ncbi:MAG: YdeI/OmpD-associated family protein [Rhodobacteraceae bacterium]|nr:YdeI/OmpD-associated family protein [Paracoccaceae bacterium]
MDFFFPFETQGEVGRYAPMGYTVAWLPVDFANALPEPARGRPRVVGEHSGVAFKGALHPTSDGRAYFIFSKDMRKKTGLGEGDPVRIAFRYDDPVAVDVPEALACALREVEMDEVWDGLAAGTRRRFAHRVTSAKTEPTRLKRVAEVLLALEDPNPSPYLKWRK